MNLNLTGRRALVTGASRGIGAATARVLAEEGCSLDLVARDTRALRRLADEIGSEHGTAARVHPADLRDPDAVAALAERTGDVDILVNNAGDIPGGPLDALDDRAWRRAFDLKVLGYIGLTRHVYGHMSRRGGGVIVNNIGASAERFDATFIAGSTGNAALTAFTRTLGGVSLRDGIRVVGVSPGPVDTERIVSLLRSFAEARLGDAERHAELTAAFPRGRAATTREIADTIAFLASDRSAYTSGTVVTVDGGMSAAASV
ncbi:short-chain dehydrogenase/reductase [Streptomyces sp. NPDC091294]|uniref:short-chain dehydrogenase/reductase n=1 Tax=Streptomyces sp. NPDC091294 TaxID=3365992 RepID=UPI00382057CA